MSLEKEECEPHQPKPKSYPSERHVYLPAVRMLGPHQWQLTVVRRQNLLPTPASRELSKRSLSKEVEPERLEPVIEQK
jgi:hypothetical protein